MNTRILTLKEAADALRLSTKTVRRYCDDGRLKRVQWRPHGPIRIPESSVEALITGRRPYV